MAKKKGKDPENVSFSVEDEISLGLKGAGKEEAEDILKALDLLSFKHRHPLSLSGGQKQRVAIAVGFLENKKIIIFDEPTSGLDLNHMLGVSEMIDLTSKKNIPILIISHDYEFIVNNCNQVIHMEKGRIKESYALDERGIGKLQDFFLFRNRNDLLK